MWRYIGFSNIQGVLQKKRSLYLRRMKDNGVYIAVVISKRLEASLLADIPQFDGRISRGSCNQRPSNIGCNVPLGFEYFYRHNTTTKKPSYQILEV